MWRRHLVDTPRLAVTLYVDAHHWALPLGVYACRRTNCGAAILSLEIGPATLELAWR